MANARPRSPRGPPPPLFPLFPYSLSPLFVAHFFAPFTCPPAIPPRFPARERFFDSDWPTPGPLAKPASQFLVPQSPRHKTLNFVPRFFFFFFAPGKNRRDGKNQKKACFFRPFLAACFLPAGPIRPVPPPPQAGPNYRPRGPPFPSKKKNIFSAKGLIRFSPPKIGGKQSRIHSPPLGRKSKRGPPFGWTALFFVSNTFRRAPPPWEPLPACVPRGSPPPRPPPRPPKN